jgi:hypothetical protein
LDEAESPGGMGNAAASGDFGACVILQLLLQAKDKLTCAAC